MRRFPQHALIWTADKVARERAGEPQTHHYRLPADQLEALETNAMSWRGKTNEGTPVVFTVWRNAGRFAVFFEGAQKSLWGVVQEDGQLYVESIGASLDHNANRNPGRTS
jgi:hypothetical protein